MRNQYLSRPDVKEYLKEFPDVTEQEKAALVKWLQAGNSPYTNGDYISGQAADFINALRFMKELYEEWQADSQAFERRQTQGTALIPIDEEMT